MEGDYFPDVVLIGVKPGVGEGSDIFGEPEEDGDEEGGKEGGHSVWFFVDGEGNPAFAEEPKNDDEEWNADVGNIMVAEEVEVDDDGEDGEYF